MDQIMKLARATSTWQACQVRRTYWVSAPLCTSKEAVKGSGKHPFYKCCILFLKAIRSSYDRNERYIASPGYTGPTCQQGHRMLARVYKQPGRHCDICESAFEEGNTGKCCKVRYFLPKALFIHESFRFANMTCALRVYCWILLSSPARQFTVIKSRRQAPRLGDHLSVATWLSSSHLPTEPLLSRRLTPKR